MNLHLSDRDGGVLGKAVLVSALTLALVPVLGPSPAYACSCEARTQAQLYRSSDVVFKGTVKKSTTRTVTTYSADGLAASYYGSTTHVLKPSRVYKGDVRPRQKVRTDSGSSCAFDLKGTGPFLIFGHRPKPERDIAEAREDSLRQPLRTDACTCSRRIGIDEDPPFARPAA